MVPCKAQRIARKATSRTADLPPRQTFNANDLPASCITNYFVAFFVAFRQELSAFPHGTANNPCGWREHDHSTACALNARRTRRQWRPLLGESGRNNVTARGFVRAAGFAYEASRCAASGALQALHALAVLHNGAIPEKRQNCDNMQWAAAEASQHPQPPAHRTKLSSCCIMALNVLSLNRARASIDMLDATSVSVSSILQL